MDNESDMIKVTSEWEWAEALDILKTLKMGKIYIKQDENKKSTQKKECKVEKVCKKPKLSRFYNKVLKILFAAFLVLLVIKFATCFHPKNISNHFVQPNFHSEKDLETQVKRLELLAFEQLTNRHFKRAEKMYHNLLKLKPRHSLALYNLACVQTLLGKGNEALESLRQAIEEADYLDVEHMRRDPDLNAIRNTPQFTSLLHKLERKRNSKLRS